MPSPPFKKKKTHFIGSLDSSYTEHPTAPITNYHPPPPLPASSLLTLTDSCSQFGSPGCWRERPVRGTETPLEAGNARGKCWRQIRRKGRRERWFVMEMRWQVCVSQGVFDHSPSQDAAFAVPVPCSATESQQIPPLAPHRHPIRPHKPRVDTL
jgi:hypothetical protein